MRAIKNLAKKILIKISRIKIKLLLKRNYKNVYVFYPFFIWNEVLFQREHQMSKALSKIPGNIVFFCTRYPSLDKCYGIRKKSKNLYVTSEYEYIMSLDKYKKIFHTYSVDAVSTMKDVKYALRHKNKILYEFIDDFNPKFVENYSDDYISKHEFLLKNKDTYVVASADNLYQEVKKYRKKNYAFITNGVWVKDFHKEYNRVPKDMKDIKHHFQKVILYYGALASWFDYELMNKCAKKYPHYAFILIGRTLDDSLEKSKVLSNRNVCFLGPKKYNELFKYTHNSDLLIIPFLINDITKATNPIKIFEYMASQRPILTTNMHECQKYKSVIIGRNHQDFMDKIDSTIEKINDQKYLDKELEEALANSWDSKAQTLNNLIK